MVKHRRSDGTEYWQLPGGGILPGESPEAAALRELHEETNLAGHIVRLLFTMPYKFGLSTTFLVEADVVAPLSLGYDPEEIDGAHRKLVEIAWLRVAEMRENPEIKQLLRQGVINQ